jgi:hypothetical protein
MSNNFRTSKKTLSNLEEYNEIVHKKIHGGKYFNIYNIGQLNASAKNKLLFETSSMFCHVTIPNITISEGILKVTITELPSVSNLGTAVNVNNSNQNSRLTSTVSCRQGCTFAADGTTIYESYVFGGNKVPGVGGVIREELILKLNTKYGIIIENVGNTGLNYALYKTFYETDENYNESEV